MRGGTGVHEQCPTTIRKGFREGTAATAVPRAGGLPGTVPWRSLEQLADTPAFRQAVEREFPAGASELRDGATRREFLRLMGASLALAGLAGMPACRRPDHRIMPYAARVPEEVIPGQALFYATSMPLPGGGAEGLIVETHEGRPTKVEGNPLHPLNQGKSSVWSQASVLSLYDPDRLKYPVYRGVGEERAATWDDFKAWARDHFARFDATRGRGLAFLVRKQSSPSREAVRDRLLTRFPEAMWVPYEPAESPWPVQGAILAFGVPVRERLTLVADGQIRARVIVSLGRDFLGQDDGAMLVHAREWAATRRVMTTRDPMSRLYVLEPGVSNTGACADHRLRLAPSRLAAFAVQLAQALAARAPDLAWGPLAEALRTLRVPRGDDIPTEWVDAIADDLLFEDDGHGGRRARHGETLILAGPMLAPEIHALVHALNAVLGNAGRTVAYLPMERDEAADSARGLAELAAAMHAGRVSTLVCVETNPLYDAPPGLRFDEAFQRLTTVCLSVESTETAAAATWSLNGAHYLESWGDTRACDGTLAPMQPMIAPLYEPAYSGMELLAMIADPHAGTTPPPAPDPAAEAASVGMPPHIQEAARPGRVDDGYEIVRATWRVRLGGTVGDARFEKQWRRALHDGVFPVPPERPGVRPVAQEAVAAGLSRVTLPDPPTEQSLEAVFVPGMTWDGRFANNGWLQELPQPGTRVTWDNPALVSPGTARALGLLPAAYRADSPSAAYTTRWPRGRRAAVRLGDRTLEVAVWVLPGMADGTVIFPLGYGREACGRVGDGVGFNTFRLRDADGTPVARGVRLEARDGEFPIASTQNHWALEGRTSIVRQVDLIAWQRHGDDPPLVETDRFYGTVKSLNFAERVGHGELAHTPPNLNIYVHPYTGGIGEQPTDPAAVFSRRPQWGMSIDLSACTGCGACTIACQAENNIPIVGKKEVAKNREMHWIRVDRYFVGDPENPQRVLHQPVPCMQCENAPCETVCPVNATVHGPEGLNYQVYNRCIGTRYCQNNCPYKVRRFNFFDYGVVKFNGEYVGKETVERWVGQGTGIGSGRYNRVNPNLIPPRLRQKLDQIERFQKNPNVTVRSRGVMEKCTYCIQRLNEARIELKRRGQREIPDGFVQTACQQACPTGAIEFGDLLDTAARGGQGSVVRQRRQHPRTYLLLGYLNTRPRTTYMLRVDNPNPRLRRPVEDPFGHGPPGDHAAANPLPARAASATAEPRMDRAAFVRDRVRALADRGYALSLRVLSRVGG